MRLVFIMSLTFGGFLKYRERTAFYCFIKRERVYMELIRVGGKKYLGWHLNND